MNEFSVHGDIRAPARRIVSLAPSITELLFYLGLGDSIIGVTRQCDYPASVRGINNIGSFLIPDTKRILELSPDTIIGFSALHQHIPEIIKNGQSGMLLFDYHSVQGVLDVMDVLASLAIEVKTALGLVTSLRQRVDALQTGNNNGSLVRTLFLITENPIMVPGRNSYQYDALQIAGAVQMPYNYAQYERVTLEEVVHFNPEIILACGRHRGEPPIKMCPDCQSSQPICQRVVDDIALKPKWKETTAASTGNIVAIPCHWLCRPGPRLIDGMESIAEVLQRCQHG